MLEHTDRAIFMVETIDSVHRWTVSQRCILTTTCVGKVYNKFHEEKGDIIRSVFQKVGLSLPVDGSRDSELDIKGFMGLEIGNWRNDIGTVSQETEISVSNDDNQSIEFVES